MKGRPFQGREGWLAILSVGFTHGYSRLGPFGAIGQGVYYRLWGVAPGYSCTAPAGLKIRAVAGNPVGIHDLSFAGRF